MKASPFSTKREEGGSILDVQLDFNSKLSQTLYNFCKVNTSVFSNVKFSEITEPTFLKPEYTEPYSRDATNSNVKGLKHYKYDMTYYMSHPQQRTTDATDMARLVDNLWSRFKQLSPSSDYPDVLFRDTFHGTRRCLNFLKTPEDIFKYYFQMCKIVPPNSIFDLLNTSIQKVIPFFSMLKSYIHTHIDSLPPISYCYSELDTIAGYPVTQHRALPEDPRDWLTNVVNDLHDSNWWGQEIYSLLLKNVKQSNNPLMRFIDFLKSPWLWVTSGAASQSRLLLDEVPVRTKLGAALSLNTDQLLGCVMHSLNPESVNLDIFVKADERGFKRRLIANMDLGSYLIAAYIRYLIEWLDGPVPHWMTATTNPKRDLEVISLLRLHKRSMPLDESKFDHHVSHAAWQGFLLALDSIFPQNIGVELFTCLFKNTRYKYENRKDKWWSGMPSGLAITSLANTLFNYIKQQAISSPIHFALGDDALLFPEPGYTLKQISEYYTTFGAEVNVTKNWESTHYAEFLHFLYSTNARVGIPARIYGSLIYGLQFKDVTPLQRINELTQLFKDFYDRAVLPFDHELVAADLARAVSKRWAGFSTQVAKTWLHIPKALNGFGFLPYVPKQFTVKTETARKLRYSGSLYTLKDQILPLKTTWSIDNIRLTSSKFRRGAKLRIEPPTTMQEWVDRINFSSKQYTPIELQYGQETIPLPELDYVSTSRMSQFATMWRYNAYPNITGSKRAQDTRFIEGSLLLAQQVRSWLAQNTIFVYV